MCLFNKLERLSLVINGLKDYDQLVLETSRVYLIQQFCLQREHQQRDLTEEGIKPEWLKPME